MKRRNLIKYLSVLPLSGAVIGSGIPFQSVLADDGDFSGIAQPNGYQSFDLDDFIKYFLLFIRAGNIRKHRHF